MTGSGPAEMPLTRHVWSAYKRGGRLSLGHCVYGPATGGPLGYINETMPYYRLLAGHCVLTGAQQVVEVGTHYGGSTLALLEGLRAAGGEPRLVTMDVTTLATSRLASEREVTCMQADATDPVAMRQAARMFARPGLDLLYIDAVKDAAFVLRVIRSAVEAGLVPRWLILDDVQASDTMRALWARLEARQPRAACLVSRHFPEIRRPEMGYGVIKVEGEFDLAAECAALMAEFRVAPRPDDGDDGGFARARAALRDAPAGAYRKRAGDDARKEASWVECEALYALARSWYTADDGLVVETGCGSGATTRALATGLADNPSLAHAFALVHALDPFRATRDVAEHASALAVDATTLPSFHETLRGHETAVNALPTALNTFAWFGQPLAVAVLGGQVNPQTSAHLLNTLTPWLRPERGLLLNREIFNPHRPWAAYMFAFLGDHLELIDVAGGKFALFGLTGPIPAWRLKRLVENDFAPAERVALILADAERRGGMYRLRMLHQAAKLATKLGLHDPVPAIVAHAREAMGEFAEHAHARRLATAVAELEATAA